MLHLPVARTMLVLRARGVDAMVGRMKKTIAASIVALTTLGVPATSFAQGRYYYEDNYRRSPRCERRHDARAEYARPWASDSYRARNSYSYERYHRRSNARTALTIAGAAATGAGIGGAFRGGKGAL